MGSDRRVRFQEWTSSGPTRRKNARMPAGFTIRSEIRVLGTIAINRSIREVALLKRLHGPGRWRKMKGEAIVDQEAAHMTMTHRKPRYLICVKNAGYEASLERRKVYRALPNSKAESHGLVRVLDESGEDYLYPADFFVAIELPKEAAPVFAAAQS